MKNFALLMLAIAGMALAAYVSFLWPPNLYRFARTWREGLGGTGLGPGIWQMFLPVMWVSWALAALTDCAIIGGLAYGASHLQWIS